eukprot:TRINITY_DN22505_c0_g1_i1.p1 TRINITY_DN22505_c0_g1~~TRINITY_DN22505_c0_g1_i1.p1  ORF type:complete len:1148 (-),score=576.86 TRINITY_DN22505_c0_g1_i1:152-3595(-)
MDFLADANVAGQTLLRLTARGNAIIAELLRLSQHVPHMFRMADKVTVKKYENIIFDFRYMKNSDLYEHRIENSLELLEFDQNFKLNNVELLKRFYVLFESFYKYIKDFLQYIVDLDEGVFIQHSLESVLLNTDGKQLIAEAVFLYGIMLTLLDEVIEGAVRERLLVSYLRYKGKIDEPNFDEVCRLVRSTGHVPGSPRNPANYPEEYFARIKLPPHLVQMLIARLRSDDIYNQISAYPLPQHRSVALANQACMLYIVLFFSPEILKDQMSVMREIVDKHFPDNWVIQYYLGYTVDLTVAWAPYKAASVALGNTLQPANVQLLKTSHWGRVDTLLRQTHHYLSEGVLNDEFILDNVGKLMAHLRDCNVTIRWMMLHVTSQLPKVRQVCVQEVSAEKLLVLLLDTAQYEFVLKNCFQAILNAKKQRWEQHRAECAERMKELGEYFSGDKPLTRVKRNETLMNWFVELATQISALDFSDSLLAGRKIMQLLHALEKVEEFHQIESSIQVKQFLVETRSFLKQMLRLVNIDENLMVVFDIVADLSYGWQIINDYVDIMQVRIRRDPSSVIKLRATFLKLCSILQLPLIRINQCRSPDLVSVSEYYSGELVAFVRKVLEIVPRSMFLILAKIIELQTTRIRELPAKIDKEQLLEAGQMSDRFNLAALTHSISVFTEGILAMETTLVGVIQVDAKQLLEDGIRKELVQQIASSLDATLQFKVKKIEEFAGRLNQLHTVLDGIRRSFQYIQDYLQVYGLKIWQEEFSRIINYNIEQECNQFLKKKVYDFESVFQSKSIPIPRFPPVDETSSNFIGRLLRELLTYTDHHRTIYIEQMAGWYDPTGREVVGIKTFDTLLRSISVFGLAGLDKLICFRIVKELTMFASTLHKELGANDQDLKNFYFNINSQLSPVASLPPGVQKLYGQALQKSARWWPMFLEIALTVGQMQLLRRQIANTLTNACQLDSNLLASTLVVANKSILKDVQEHYVSPDTKPYPSDESAVLADLTEYLETAGINDPYTKIYVTTDPISHIGLIMFMFAISQISVLEYSSHLSILVHKKDKRSYDIAPLVVGIITILKQFHQHATLKFLALLGQFVRNQINVVLQKDAKVQDFPPEVICALLFLEEFCKQAKTDRKIVEGYLPAYLFNFFTH